MATTVASWYPEGNNPTSNDQETRSLQKINALLVGIVANTSITDTGDGGFQVTNGQAAFQAIPTAFGARTAGLSVIPVINVSSPGKLDFYVLTVGSSGIQPNDYNGSTNNVSWVQYL